MELSELKELVGQWEGEKGRVRAENVRYHYRKHASGASLRDYLLEAVGFPKGHAKMKARDDGTLIFRHRDGRFLILRAQTQKIVSYGRNC